MILEVWQKGALLFVPQRCHLILYILIEGDHLSFALAFVYVRLSGILSADGRWI